MAAPGSRRRRAIPVRAAAVVRQAGLEVEQRWRSRGWEDHGAFDEDRGLTAKSFWSACYAPFSSLYLDQFGAVRACCQNSEHPLGHVARSSLREIWEGAAAEALRAALRAGDMTRGCGFCKWQTTETGRAPFARNFDGHAVRSATPEWPSQLEFALTNACNLQCVMCDGDFSSAIRAHREHRAPLPRAYDDRFFAEVEEFLPHLQSAKFVGGEPFIGPESLRMMGLIEEVAPSVAVTVTTNATIRNRRVEELMERLRMDLVVSLDGASPGVYESIRVGASFTEVLANIDRFREVVEPRGGRVVLTHCLMTGNWHEFDDFLRLAERRSLGVFVNTVSFPVEHSLHQLPAAELASVVAEMERRTPLVERDLSGVRLQRWHEQLRALRGRLDAAERPGWLGATGR
jgi:MoaA/NifB/PqqE/SkfB family radical SAM enzyme